MKARTLTVASAALIFLSLLATVSTSGAQELASPAPPDYTYLAISEPAPPEPQMAPLRPGALEPSPPGTGSILPPMDLSHLTGQRMPGDVVPQTLPDRFDWRNKEGFNYVTSVKDQANCGSCYAFGAIGNFESKLLIDGMGSFDFSENHAKECNWREVNNFQYPGAGDYWGSCDGGNAYMLASLFSQQGTVLETCDPYQDSDVGCKSTCAYEKTLLDWRVISFGVPDTTVLKQYIYDNGPVITSMYADSGQGFNNSYDGSYTFNYTTSGYNINHCVLIVGWSDDLPPVPGGTDPAEGWIVKNSWGTGWGDNGYFYITPGAANIGTSSSFVNDWQDYDVNGDVWYYDDDGWWGNWGYENPTAWGLAKFIPASNTNVTRVEFWTTDVTTDVDVYVYDDFNGSTLSNLLASKQNNSFSEAGYHSVALDSPVPVTSGDDVIAVVKFTNESYGYPMATDPHGTVETGRTYMSESGSGWIDMGAIHDTDVAIRLRTSTSVTSGPRVTSITPSSGANTGPIHITDLAGSDFQSGASVKLTKSGQPDVNATNVTVVSASQITCDFDLTGVAIGSWHVVVTNPDTQSGMLPNGFTVLGSGILDRFVYLPAVLKYWPPLPETPVLYAISGGADGNYTVSWSTADRANTYTLEEDNNASFSSPVARYNGAGTSWSVSGKAPGTYYYRVKASNSWGDSGWSDARQVVVYSVPGRPTLNLINNPDGDGNYTVSWTAVAQAQTYRLQEDDNTSFSSPVARYNGAGTSWNASGKAPGTYYYRVRASNMVGHSSWSNIRPVTVQGQAEWVTIMSENFEGAFPGGTWEVRDNDPDSGRYYWGKRNCKDNGGSFSAWSVGAGDTTLGCGSNYPNDVFAWMVYGPFNLSNATAAELVFDWWSDTEYGYDIFFWGASTDGDDYYGTIVTGDWSSWTTGEKLDLSAVPTLGNLLGENQVWIAFVFGSDYSYTDKGSFVDNVVLRKRVGAATTGGEETLAPQHVLQPNQTLETTSLRLEPIR